MIDDIPPVSKDPVEKRLARLEAETRHYNWRWTLIGLAFAVGALAKLLQLMGYWTGVIRG